MIAQPFESREDVELWIIRNQLGRRNLSDYQRGVYALRIKPVVAEQAKRKMDRESRELGPSGQKSAQSPVKTRDVVAKLAGVSHDTIRKVEQIEARAIPEVRAKAASGEISINKAAAVASVPAEEQPAMLAKVTAPKAERLARRPKQPPASRRDRRRKRSETNTPTRC